MKPPARRRALDRSQLPHCPQAKSWVEGSQGHSEFPIQNLPFCIFSAPGTERPRGGVAIGDLILDVAGVAQLLPATAARIALQADATSLNALFALGNDAMRTLRLALFDLLADAKHETSVRPYLHIAADCAMHLPFAIGDYTDFYAGIHHAENIGRLFRPENPLLPNYKYVPIGYHGRSSSDPPERRAGRAPAWPESWTRHGRAALLADRAAGL